jgi:hypothetical protein
MATTDASHLREIVERALRRELAARRELRPHVQLAIAPDADAQMIAEAYQRQQRRYAPADYAQHGEACVEVAREIGTLITAAYETMAHARARTRGQARRGPSSWRALLARLRRVLGRAQATHAQPGHAIDRGGDLEAGT